MSNYQAVALIQAGHPNQALQAVEGTDDTFAQAGDLKRQAMALGNQASALEDLGELQTALATYTRSAGIFQQIGAQEEYAQVMKSISTLKLRQRNPLGALASLQDGLETLERPNAKQRLVSRLLKIPFNFFK